MTSAAAVGCRLDRIEALDAAGAPAGLLLDELQRLAREAAGWVEGDALEWSGGSTLATAAARVPRQAAARAVIRLLATLEGRSIQM